MAAFLPPRCGSESAPRGRFSRRAATTTLVPSGDLRRLCELDAAGERTLEMAVRRMGLSARAHDRVLKVARTIADLDHTERASPPNIWPRRCSTRSLDRNYWA